MSRRSSRLKEKEEKKILKEAKIRSKIHKTGHQSSSSSGSEDEEMIMITPSRSGIYTPHKTNNYTKV